MKKLEVKKEDLIYNLNALKDYLKAKSNAKIIAVVKSNAMGLGLVETSKILVENKVDYLGVATPDEAFELRENGIESKILLLTPIYNDAIVEKLVNRNVILTIDSKESLEIAKKYEGVKAHLKIDTGFGRYGMLYNNKEAILDLYKERGKVEFTGIFSHLSKPTDEKWSTLQFLRFKEVVNYLQDNDVNLGLIHLASSNAAIKYPNMHFDAVRVGSLLSGRTMVSGLDLRKVGTLKTVVNEVKVVPKGFNISYGNRFVTKKETKIAIIPVGYMDGFNLTKDVDDFTFKNRLVALGRAVKNLFRRKELKVTIKDKTYKVIGRLGMYHMIVDVTGSDVKSQDEVTLDAKPMYVNTNIRREYI